MQELVTLLRKIESLESAIAQHSAKFFMKGKSAVSRNDLKLLQEELSKLKESYLKFKNLKEAADKLIKLVDDFQLDTTQLRSSIERVNYTTLPELEERLEAKLNDNLSIYLNELNTVKKEKSVAFGEFIKEDFHLENFPNYSFSQIEMFIRNDFHDNLKNFITFLQEKIKDKLSDAEKELQTLYHILIYTYLNYNKTVESLYVSQKTLTAVKKQSEDLERRNKELQSQIDILVKEAEKQKEIRLSKEAKKEAKKKSKKQQRKDYITYEQFEIILNSLETKTLVDHRKKYALILLYATGLRVSNLLLLKRSNVSDLLSKGSTRLNIIKNGDCQRLILISKKSQQLLEQHATSFYQIAATKRDTDLVFTSFNGSNKPIHRSNFTKELNLLLKPFNQRFNMNFKTHSFRITFITNLINVASLHVAKNIVGHKVVASTEIYYRSSLTVEESKKILNKADEQAYKKDDLKTENAIF